MDTTIKTSLMPKDEIRETPRRQEGGRLIAVLTGVIFLCSMLFYGGAWGYQNLLLKPEIYRDCPSADIRVTKGCGLVATLERYRQNLNEADLRDIRSLNQKLLAAKQIIKNHRDIAPVFALLEATTLPSVRYRSFDYQGDVLSIEGSAATYEDIAIQSDIFADPANRDKVSSFIFSNLDLDETTRQITFALVLRLNPSFTAYAAPTVTTDAASVLPTATTSAATTTPAGTTTPSL